MQHHLGFESSYRLSDAKFDCDLGDRTGECKVGDISFSEAYLPEHGKRGSMRLPNAKATEEVRGTGIEAGELSLRTSRLL